MAQKRENTNRNEMVVRPGNRAWEAELLITGPSSCVRAGRIFVKCFPWRETWRELLRSLQGEVRGQFQEPPISPHFEFGEWLVATLRHRANAPTVDMDKKIGDLLQLYQRHPGAGKYYRVFLKRRPQPPPALVQAQQGVGYPPLIEQRRHRFPRAAHHALSRIQGGPVLPIVEHEQAFPAPGHHFEQHVPPPAASVPLPTRLVPLFRDQVTRASCIPQAPLNKTQKVRASTDPSRFRLMCLNDTIRRNGGINSELISSMISFHDPNYNRSASVSNPVVRLLPREWSVARVGQVLRQHSNSLRDKVENQSSEQREPSRE